MGITKAQALEQFQRAFGVWWKAIGLKFVLTDDRRQAHCVIDWGALSGTVLAWSNLADNTCNKNQQQRYDIRGWTPHLLFLVILHELGHLLGLPHRPGNFLMNPGIITSLDGPTPTDISDAIALGYPGPPGDDQPGDVLRISGEQTVHFPDGSTKKFVVVGYSV